MSGEIEDSFTKAENYFEDPVLVWSRRFLFTIGIGSAACMMPMMYVYGAKAGGDIVALQYIFGVSAAISFAALFAEKAGNSFVKLMHYIVRHPLDELLIKSNLFAAIVKELIFWFIAFVASLPLTYLSDQAGFGAVNIPIILVQMATFRWSQENFWITIYSKIINIGFFGLFSKNKQLLVSQKKLQENLKQVVQQLDKHQDNLFIVKGQIQDAPAEGSQLMPIDYLRTFSQLMSSQDGSTKKTEAKSNFWIKLLKSFVSLIGWCLGIAGASAYYLVGLVTAHFFYLHYFKSMEPGWTHLFVAILAIWCQGSLSGWAVSNIFTKVFDWFASIRESSWSNIINCSILIEVFKILFSGAAAIPRFEITMESTSNVILIASAFLSVFAISYHGFNAIQKTLAKGKEDKTKAKIRKVATMFSESAGHIKHDYLQQLNSSLVVAAV